MLCPSAALGQDRFDYGNDCNLMVECALEDAVLPTTGTSEETHGFTLVTHSSLAHFNQRCGEPISAQAQVTILCAERPGAQHDQQLILRSPHSLERFEEGIQRHRLEIEYAEPSERDCSVLMDFEVTLNSGRKVQPSCLPEAGYRYQDERSLWLRAQPIDAQVSASRPDRPVAPGELHTLTASFSTSSPQGEQVTLAFSPLEAPFYDLERARVTGSLPPVSVCASTELLDEQVACSNDQRPLCGCDGRVWSGACEATRAGVPIQSAKPNHPACHRDLISSHPTRLTSRFYPLLTALKDAMQGGECAALMPAQSLGPKRLEAGEQLDEELLVQGSALTPRYLLSWRALLTTDELTNYPLSVVLHQDLKASLKTACFDPDAPYVMPGCALDDLCCHQGLSCDPEQALKAFCLKRGDQDCDGLLDVAEASESVFEEDFDQDGLLDGEELKLGTLWNEADSDSDGLSDHEEWQRGTSPVSDDTDSDGLKDALDAQPRRGDADLDGLLDGEDAEPLNPDRDRDGLLDGEDPWPDQPDFDLDGLSDGAETFQNLDPADPADASQLVDSDGDGLSDSFERSVGFDPSTSDGDLDGLSDHEEFSHNTHPLQADSDGDGLSDFDEIFITLTDPSDWDSDSDGLNDLEELFYGSNPRLIDTDLDGLSDLSEVLSLSTDPARRDTDGGGLDDFIEWLAQRDALDASGDERRARSMRALDLEAEARFARLEEEPSVSLIASFEPQPSTEELHRRVLTLPYHHVAQIITLRLSDGAPLPKLNMHYLLDRPASDAVSFQGQANRDRLRATLSSQQPSYAVEVHTQVKVVSYRGGELHLPIEWDVGTSLEPTQTNHLQWVTSSQSSTGSENASPSDEHIVQVTLISSVEHHNALRVELCGDGVDNDFNGLTDCQDPRCLMEPECQMSEEDCFNNIDDDFDGLNDCDDPDCAEFCAVSEVCDDGLDNDLNGFIDCQDPDCLMAPGCAPDEYCEQGDYDYDNACWIWIATASATTWRCATTDSITTSTGLPTVKMSPALMTKRVGRLRRVMTASTTIVTATRTAPMRSARSTSSAVIWANPAAARCATTGSTTTSTGSSTARIPNVMAPSRAPCRAAPLAGAACSIVSAVGAVAR